MHVALADRKDGSYRSYGRPGIDDLDAGILEVRHIAGRHRHAARAGDGRGLAVRRAVAESGGTAPRCDVRIFLRRSAVEGKDAAVEMFRRTASMTEASAVCRRPAGRIPLSFQG